MVHIGRFGCIRRIGEERRRKQSILRYVLPYVPVSGPDVWSVRRLHPNRRWMEVGYGCGMVWGMLVRLHRVCRRIYG